MRHGPAAAAHGKPKVKDFKGTMKQLLHYLSRYKFRLLLVMLFAVASTIFTIVGPKVLGNATTELFNGIMGKITGAGAGIDFGAIANILLTLLILYLTSLLFSYGQGWIMTGLTQRVCYRMRREIVEKIDRMPLAYFERNAVGDVLSRITNDVDTVGQSLNQCVTQLITSITQIIGVTVMMLSVSVALAGLTFLTIPVSLVLIVLVVRTSQRYFRQQQALLGRVDGTIEESFSGQNVIKVFNREQRAVADFDADNDLLYQAGWRSQFLSGLMQPIMNFVANLAYVAVVSFGAFLAVAGSISVGDIQAFMQYVRNFTQPITQLTQVSNMLQMLSAAAERVFEFLAEPEETPDAVTPELPARGRGAAEFDRVRFGYVPNKTVIHDFSCRVDPGQTVAIVGPTGAGKTTLMKLLMRFYDVNAGSVRVDGVDVRDYARDDLRAGFAMVLQDTWLFQGSIMENIRYGRADATDDEVRAAARAALADHFIRTLPGGYDFELNEDASNVSQGQRQLLTIARAFIADRPILILDEATSNVDTRTEERIQRAMDALMQGRTSFVIAHRLSTIRNADVILVLRDGDIVESGTHDELLAKNGFYAELYNSQFEDGEPEE